LLSYAELVRDLFPRLTGGIRWGLERTQALLASVDNPHESYRTVHVGGTNGKGSVAATLASILTKTSSSVGLYSSPHLCSFRERVQVNQHAVTEDAIVHAAQRLWPAIEKLQPSFFEATTAIGLLAFAEAGVDVAVIEVGLGGRLDSTNVIHPELAIITNIAFDHADYLGHTLAAIAGEKAGIVKPGVPLLTSEDQAEILGLFQARAHAMRAPLHVQSPLPDEQVQFDLRGTTFTTSWRGEPCTLQTPLIGRHQGTNAAVAVRAAELLDLDLGPEDLQETLFRIRWPGRLQVESAGGQTWVFDVAHNVAGVQALVSALRSLDLPRPLVLLLGILGDKDWRAMLPPLFAMADLSILAIPPTAPSNRTWNPQLALEFAGGAHAHVIADFGAALESAHTAAGRGTVLVTGSFHTVGDALISLNRTPFGSDVTLPRASFAG
jgi:dihydrofolate synthase/folylpolyglutamate synthase